MQHLPVVADDRYRTYLLKTGETYVEQSAGEYEEQKRERELCPLTWRAHKLGLTLTPARTATDLLAT